MRFQFGNPVCPQADRLAECRSPLESLKFQLWTVWLFLFSLGRIKKHGFLARAIGKRSHWERCFCWLKIIGNDKTIQLVNSKWKDFHKNLRSDFHWVSVRLLHHHCELIVSSQWASVQFGRPPTLGNMNNMNTVHWTAVHWFCPLCFCQRTFLSSLIPHRRNRCTSILHLTSQSSPRKLHFVRGIRGYFSFSHLTATYRIV